MHGGTGFKYKLGLLDWLETVQRSSSFEYTHTDTNVASSNSKDAARFNEQISHATHVFLATTAVSFPLLITMPIFTNPLVSKSYWSTSN